MNPTVFDDCDKQELIDTLRFTPRRVKVLVHGYGGEIVMGHITAQAFDYWSQRDENELSDFVLDNFEKTVPQEAQFIEPGAWYECDDIVHHCGAEMSTACQIVIEDYDTGEEIWRAPSLDPADLEAQGVELNPQNEYYASLLPQGSFCYFGQSIEKGTFFSGDLVLRAPFDAGKLSVNYDEIEGLQILTGLQYADEIVEDTDGVDTRGKGMQFTVLVCGQG